MVQGGFIGRRPERACMRFGPASELKITNLSTLRYTGTFVISSVVGSEIRTKAAQYGEKNKVPLTL